MTRLLTNQIATMTEMREPQKVLDRAGGKPVAVLKNSKVVGYFVPADAVKDPGEHRYATMEELQAALDATRENAAPILEYLRDK